MENRKTILMIANSDTAANGFLSFMERLKDRNDIRFVMVCHSRVHLRAVREKGMKTGAGDFAVLDFDERERNKCRSEADRDYKYVKDKLYVSAGKAVFNTAKIITHNRQGLRKAKLILENEKPNVILLYADNKSELEKFFIYYAKKRHIKTVIAPI